jgi:hypothetical protein
MRSAPTVNKLKQIKSKNHSKTGAGREYNGEKTALKYCSDW